jgi:C-terminal processing protease CtpA/Prc
MKLIAPMLVVLSLIAGCRTGGMSDVRRQQHLDSFDEVWRIVHDTHYDADFNGVDWAAVRDELRPRLEAAKTDAEARDTIREMLARLKLSHFGIHSEEAAAEVSETPRTGFVPPLAQKAVIEEVKFGNLPGMPLRCHAELLPSNVEYFYLSVFMSPVKVQKIFRPSLERAREADGMIIDLRHNPGGIGGMAMGLGNHFVSEPDQKLGEMIQRGMTLNFTLNPQATPYTKPLAILIDGGSASTSEILAGGLQDLGRARVFGTKSAGMALPSLINKLANGDSFQYAVADYISTGGEKLEGRGVIPDEVVEYKPPYNAPDPVVEAAVKWIKSQTGKKQ